MLPDLELPNISKMLMAQEHLDFAAGFQSDGKWLIAAAHFRAALLKLPERSDLIKQIGHMLKEAGEFASAEAAYEAYLEHDSEDPDIHLQLGHLFARQEREADALPWYENALQLSQVGSSISADAAVGAANCAEWEYASKRRRALGMTDKGDFREAYDLLCELIDHPKGGELYGVMGNVCKELGKYEAARSFYDRHEERNVAIGTLAAVDLELQRAHICSLLRDDMGMFRHYIGAANIGEQIPSLHVDAQRFRSEARQALARITTALEI